MTMSWAPRFMIFKFSFDIISFYQYATKLFTTLSRKNLLLQRIFQAFSNKSSPCLDKIDMTEAVHPYQKKMNPASKPQ